ncbi:MAG: AMP-binding protein [Eubacterium sp.]|nr:AMP-binding protein [Eubacterium sp.]
MSSKIGSLKINAEQKKIYEETGLWTEKTLLDYWNEAVEKFGDKEYIIDNLGRRYTYKEVDRQADKLAGFMVSRGLEAGDRVSLLCPPRNEYVIIVMACIKIGVVMGGFKMRIGGDEWVELVNRMKARMNFCIANYRGDDMRIFMDHNSAFLDHPADTVYIGEPMDEENFYLDRILEEEYPRQPRPDCTSNDVAAIMFTSGTTKGSKGVLLTHNNIISSELCYNRMLGLTPEEDKMFMPCPLSHAIGFHHGIIANMLYGGTLVFLEPYKADVALDMMDREKCTYSMGATPFIYDYLKLMDQGYKKPGSLKFYVCGGAPVPYKMTKHAWEQHQLIVCECYGSTESVPHVIVPPAQAMEMEGKWSGIAMDGIEVRIIDKEGNDVKPGEEGQEISRGPNVFVGYLENPEDTAEALDDDGWFYSGDLCYGDGLGHIKISGRIKDIIIRGGENFNMSEMEAAFMGCPKIRQMGICAMKDERFGERACGFIVPEDWNDLPDLEYMHAYLREHDTSKWFCPERIEFIDEIPMTDSGKIRRNLLVKELEARLAAEADA